MSLPIYVSTEALIERLRRDVFSVAQRSAPADVCEQTYRQAWRDAMTHVEGVILPELAQVESIERGLREIVEMSPVPPLSFELDPPLEAEPLPPAPAVTRAPALDLSDACSRCAVGEQRVWDDVLECYAHACPGGALAVCNDAWRARP